MSETDLSKIINLIMENPDLVSKIRDLASAEQGENEEPAAEQEMQEEKTEATYTPVSSENRRNTLLRALKPYLSEKRGKAIESMITIADVIFAVRGG